MAALDFWRRLATILCRQERYWKRLRYVVEGWMNSFAEMVEALADTRARFETAIGDRRNPLAGSFALLFRAFHELALGLKEGDPEVHGIAVLMGAARRVFSSYVLLESGLPQEAQIILRNAIEHMLVGMELCNDSDAVEKWLADGQERHSTDGRSHHFKPRECEKRIARLRGPYSGFERHLAKQSLEEWRRISNQAVHLHSKHQIDKLLDGRGGFQFLGLKSGTAYEKDLVTLARIVFDITGILLGIPRLREATTKDKEFHDLYYQVQSECMAGGEMYLDVTSKSELEDALAKLPFGLDVSAIPDSAEISHVYIDMSDPRDPALSVTYMPTVGDAGEDANNHGE